MMNLDRLRQIINSYGSNDARWPEDEQLAALEFVKTSSDARQLLQQSSATAQQLDAWLASDEIVKSPEFEQRVTARILERILKNASERKLERFFTWLMPDLESLKTSIWRPALAACLPLVIGILLGAGITPDNTQSEDNAWDEELYLLALTDQMPRQWSGDWSDE